jgi:hypothetical protein
MDFATRDISATAAPRGAIVVAAALAGAEWDVPLLVVWPDGDPSR